MAQPTRDPRGRPVSAQLTLGLEHPTTGTPWVPPGKTDTSLEAGASVAGETAKTWERKVFDCLNDSPKTDEEVQLALGMKGNSVRPRRKRLELRGLVRDSGARRKTSSGRNAIVWEVIEPWRAK